MGIFFTLFRRPLLILVLAKGKLKEGILCLF